MKQLKFIHVKLLEVKYNLYILFKNAFFQLISIIFIFKSPFIYVWCFISKFVKNYHFLHHLNQMKTFYLENYIRRKSSRKLFRNLMHTQFDFYFPLKNYFGEFIQRLFYLIKVNSYFLL